MSKILIFAGHSSNVSLQQIVIKHTKGVYVHEKKVSTIRQKVCVILFSTQLFPSSWLS